MLDLVYQVGEHGGLLPTAAERRMAALGKRRKTMLLGGDLGFLAIWESNGYGAALPYLIRHPPTCHIPIFVTKEKNFYEE